jgi:hypothetical protein
MELVIETVNGKVNLGRELFWEINEKDIGKALMESDEWVVPRVFEYGTLKEIAEIIRYYGKEKVVEILFKISPKPMSKAMAWYFLSLDL